MKFGEHLRSSLIKDYNFYYISYDELKHDLKKGLAQNNAKWSNELEEKFLTSLEDELDKVYSFTKVKSTEINRRIKDSEQRVTDLVGRINSEFPPLDAEFDILYNELETIISNVHDLSKFSMLNYTGFQKIIKKHDKLTGFILKPIFQVRLDAKPFFKENYDPLIVKLSKSVDLVRTKGNPVKGDSSAGGGQQNFVRQTTKYWVHPDNITELKLIVLKHLPVLVFNANKEFDTEDSAITSIYYDNKHMDLYNGRLLKTEGAEAIRMRWYGGMKSDAIFVERKTHREDWTGEKSVKARFVLKEKKVNDFMSGDFTYTQAFEKMRKEGKKSVQEINSLQALAQEVQFDILTKKYRPVMRSFYNRTAFQLPGDARVRISLDTELTMVREDNFDGYDRTHGNWRRMDIGVDFPFNQLPESDVERFPYAVLEVKLQTQLGQEPPQWIRDLVSSHLVEAIPKFSKFIHGCATLLPERVDLIPFWLPQMEVDIRKPKIVEDYGIQHISDNTDGHIDEEEFVGGYNNSSSSVRFANNAALASTDEQTPLLLPSSSYSTPPSSTSSEFLSKLEEYYNVAKSYFQDDRSFAGLVKPGTDFDLAQHFKVPEGKTISIPVRIEPKVYFANERTILSWLSIAMVIGATSTALLVHGDKSAIISSVAFFITAELTLIYSTAMYLWRTVKIRNKEPANYVDEYGPTGICIALSAAVFATFLFKYLESGK